METKTILVSLLLTFILGGGAAVLMGRNFATNWRSHWAVALAGVGLALGVRFLHYALFQETLLTANGFLVDLIVIIAFGLLGFRWRRADQMATQYYWLYERTGPLTWRAVTKTDDKA
jgi:uncharacterized membrane protein AbrB (regulator of aidB expression)